MDDCPAATTTLGLFSPCHCVEVTGGPAVVWCPACGRSFQADAPELLLVALAQRLADRSLYETANTGGDVGLDD